MKRHTARGFITSAPFAFVLVLAGCSSESEPPAPAATSFGVVHASSTSRGYSVDARFTADVSSNCETRAAANGCMVSVCASAEAAGRAANAGVLTVQGDETVVLDADNQWQAEADRPLFGNGDEVLVDLSESSEVPGFRATMNAPSSTSLSEPVAAEGEPLQLTRGSDLLLEWVPGNYGLMKFHASSGLVGMTCEWTISDGVALVTSGLLAELPASDGSESRVLFWTEQNAVVRESDWEFLLLLSGEAQNATFAGYVLAE